MQNLEVVSKYAELYYKQGMAMVEPHLRPVIAALTMAYDTVVRHLVMLSAKLGLVYYLTLFDTVVLQPLLAQGSIYKALAGGKYEAGRQFLLSKAPMLMSYLPEWALFCKYTYYVALFSFAIIAIRLLNQKLTHSVAREAKTRLTQALLNVNDDEEVSITKGRHHGSDRKSAPKDLVHTSGVVTNNGAAEAENINKRFSITVEAESGKKATSLESANVRQNDRAEPRNKKTVKRPKPDSRLASKPATFKTVEPCGAGLYLVKSANPRVVYRVQTLGSSTQVAKGEVALCYAELSSNTTKASAGQNNSQKAEEAAADFMQQALKGQCSRLVVLKAAEQENLALTWLSKSTKRSAADKCDSYQLLPGEAVYNPTDANMSIVAGAKLQNQKGATVFDGCRASANDQEFKNDISSNCDGAWREIVPGRRKSGFFSCCAAGAATPKEVFVASHAF